MLISHPRFLARLLASLPRRSQTKLRNTRPVSAYAFDMGDDNESRVVGGGCLKEGWVLRKGGETRLAAAGSMEKSDPFASPFDEPLGRTLQPALHPTSTLYPPPHIAPMLSYIPYSSTLLFAPFARMPRFLAFLSSPATLVPLYIIFCYLTLCAFALIWRSDISPTTKAKGYGSDFMRTGLVATTQIPLVVALGVRGNIIGLCVGKGYEKLKIFHKVVGRVAFLAATLHTLFFCESGSRI
jgi:ferric-chelate reductase